MWPAQVEQRPESGKGARQEPSGQGNGSSDLLEGGRILTPPIAMNHGEIHRRTFAKSRWQVSLECLKIVLRIVTVQDQPMGAAIELTREVQ
jgi:hypothetical protein